MPRRHDEGFFPSRIVNFFTAGDTWTYHHFSTFLLTFFSYAFFHASRKTLSLVKPSLMEVWSHNTTHGGPLFPSEADARAFFGVLDCAFLGAYAFGLYVGGALGDRYDPRIVLSVGMWSSAVMVFLFGTVTEWFHFYSKGFYLTIWILCGLFQSVGWPTEVCVMGNWFGHGSRGAVLGLWSACASVGNIIGTVIASHSVRLGYEYVFAINSLTLFAGGFVVCAMLHSTPRELGLPDPLESRDEPNRVVEVVGTPPKPIAFLRAWLLPGVVSYSLAYACLKFVNYSFFFCLPLYLHTNFGWDEATADAISIWYDIGGIVAAVIAGIASDHFSTRTPTVVTMLVLSMFSLFFYSRSPNNVVINSILMTIMGFFIGGPANLISSAVSADLGKAPEIRGSAQALSTVTGIVDGTGSVGAAIGQLLISGIQAELGWTYVFYCFIVMMFMTCVCLFPLLFRELRDIHRRRQYQLLHPGDTETGQLTDDGGDRVQYSDDELDQRRGRQRHFADDD